MDQFKDQIRTLTQRKIPLRLSEVIETINPIIRGWGNYYCRSHVRKRFHQLDGWIIRRLWSHRTKRWRNAAWREYPTKRLRTEFKLVSLVLTEVAHCRLWQKSPSAHPSGAPALRMPSYIRSRPAR